MGSPSISNKVVTFRYLKRYGVMDAILKLCSVSTWAFVQNRFPYQGSEHAMKEESKVFNFKMSEVGSGSGVDQPW